MSWPPTLEELVLDMKDPNAQQGAPNVQADSRLQQTLDAAVAYVERVKAGVYQFDVTDPDQFELPEPPNDFRLGTLRLAARWHHRRMSSGGLISLGELGTTQVPGSDPDIDRMLRIGRYTTWKFA